MIEEQHPAWWKERARHYWEMAENALERCSAGFCLGLLQHATEFYLKALVRQHAGDHPFTRNPYTLMHIATLYEPGLRKIFPRNTMEEIRLFSWLNPYRLVPGEPNDKVSPGELEVLIRRLKQLEHLGSRAVDVSDRFPFNSAYSCPS